MAILGSIIKRTFELRERMPRIRKVDGYKQQVKLLKKLLAKAEFTAFGEHYNFSRILSEDETLEAFRTTVKVHDYNSMFAEWWNRCVKGEANVSWPGKIRYFALSSGTSDAASKYIPVSSQMLRAIRKSSIRQIMSLSKYDLPEEHFERGVLMVGGSTDLKYNGTFYEGDLSGITRSTIPFYAQNFNKPGKEISKEWDWEKKLEEISQNAASWDIGVVCGVPSWIQILFEKIISDHKLNNIHDIWPNLRVYIHGGVFFGPYKTGFQKLLGRELLYCDSYLASEGFIAFQDRQGTEAMRMVLDNGLFYEFVPFNEKNFIDGEMIANPETYHIGEVKEGQEYALLLSTVSGAWRYLIGDVVKFTSLANYELIIVGRTKHYLSLCGEHLSQDNMNRAIQIVAEEMKIEVKEFTVAGISYDSLFAHHWYIGTDDPADANVFKKRLDEVLKELNDDYKVERISALRDVIVEMLPSQVFYDFLQHKGKMGNSFKFPRVLKNTILEDWKAFLKNRN
jgi:hypothetical protein